MAVSAVAVSVIVRNSTIEARFPGGMSAFAASSPNATYCTDGSVSRVAFMNRVDAETFLHQLVAAGIAPSLKEAHSEIALVQQGQGFAYPCDWLQLGLFNGHACAWLASADRGKLFIPKWELDPKMRSYTDKEFREKFELIGLRDNGKMEVHRDRVTGEILYVGRPFRPVLRKWWQFWKRLGPQIVDEKNYAEVFDAAQKLIRPYIGHQLSEAAVSPEGQKQLRKALAMLNEVIQFNPGDWAALWDAGIASKCLRELGPAYSAFHRAYELEKKNPAVGRELAGICMALGKGEEAVRISQEVTEKNPQDAGLRSNHALALLIAGQVQEAATEVQNALKLEPGDEITKNLAKFIDEVRTNRVPRPDRWPMR